MPPLSSAPSSALGEQSREFYQSVLRLLAENRLRYLVGGAYAFAPYTGIERHTKDFDIFICGDDWPHAERILRGGGYQTQLTFPHWIGKAFKGDDFIDLIFSAGNGVAKVDELWFKYAVPAKVLDMDVMLIPPEEMIWSKGLIMERERFDGADVAHLIRALGETLDWRRLIDRYGEHWRALYSHLILFGFIYPSDRHKVPAAVMKELAERLTKEMRSTNGDEKICYGTILSRQQYLVDIDRWGYEDARLRPLGTMSADDIARWTAGIEEDGKE